jgi:hypothetical protein
MKKVFIYKEFSSNGKRYADAEACIRANSKKEADKRAERFIEKHNIGLLYSYSLSLEAFDKSMSQS